MRPLLDYLREQSYTLTVYNCDEDEMDVESLGRRLAGDGIVVRTDETASGHPANFGVLHRGGEVLDVARVDDLVVTDESYDGLLDGDRDRDRPDIFERVDREVAISPETGRTAMVRISREFERRAWEHGEGTLHAGFQDLSMLDGSERTRDVYERIAATDLSVTIYGYPDETLSEVPYEVVEDDEELFREYWFLLYDGGGDPTRKAAMVSRESDPDRYDAFWTVDPDTVDALFHIAAEEYPAYF